MRRDRNGQHLPRLKQRRVGDLRVCLQKLVGGNPIQRRDGVKGLAGTNRMLYAVRHQDQRLADHKLLGIADLIILNDFLCRNPIQPG